MSILYFNVSEDEHLKEVDTEDLETLLEFIRKVGRVVNAIGCEPLTISVGPNMLPRVWRGYAQVRILRDNSPVVWRIHRVCALQPEEVIVTFDEELARAAALVRAGSRVLN
jgi:hypothetical protein